MNIIAWRLGKVAPSVKHTLLAQGKQQFCSPYRNNRFLLCSGACSDAQLGASDSHAGIATEILIYLLQCRRRDGVPPVVPAWVGALHRAGLP